MTKSVFNEDWFFEACQVRSSGWMRMWLISPIDTLEEWRTVDERGKNRVCGHFLLALLQSYLCLQVFSLFFSLFPSFPLFLSPASQGVTGPELAHCEFFYSDEEFQLPTNDGRIRLFSSPT